ncbi:MAG: GNAT family N-acetyltransferase, partial [Geminicoccales bacterium]
LSVGPFDSAEAYEASLLAQSMGDDPLCYAIVDRRTGRAAGTASYLRIDPRAGSIEVGSITYSPQLQRSAMATEAMYLMMHRVFELGYRRYEWKCNALNAASRRAAERLGFTYEGLFRQATVTKGRNRDTAWFSILDCEWPTLKAAFEAWLDPGNFDADGQQRRPLHELISNATAA